jgi:ABC-2 type transport system permease protein
VSHTLRIARRELSAFFNSPIAYIVLGVFLVVSGYLFFFFSGLFIVGKASMRGFFGLAPVLFLFLAPAITMRLIAEERKSGTLETLMTLPVKEWEIVAGKFLAAVGTVFVCMLFTLPYPLSLYALTAANASFDWGPVIGGYLGVMLMSSSFIAWGMWASAMNKNQIVGFIVGLALCFALWIPDRVAIVLPDTLGGIAQYLSVNYHFENVARGVIDTRDLFYYLTVTAIGLLATTRQLASVRQ